MVRIVVHFDEKYSIYHNWNFIKIENEINKIMFSRSLRTTSIIDINSKQKNECNLSMSGCVAGKTASL